MNPPAKRVKLMDGSSTSNIPPDAHTLEDALQHGKPSVSDLKHHDVLWYEDGSIVLATDVHLYCVHKSILASNSTVFKDMLTMPMNTEGIIDSQGTHMDKEEDIYEGKPVVRMFGDSDENVYHLLMTLYDRNFFRAGKRTTASIALSLLVMSSKYDVPVIRTEIIEHLKRYYSCNFTNPYELELKDLFCGSKSSDGRANNFDGEEFTFLLLDAALRTSTLSLLPAIYYECAVLPLGKILSLSRKLSFEPEVVEKIMHGRERLSKLSYLFGANTLHPQVKCAYPACLEMRTELFFNWINCLSYKHPEFPKKLVSGGFASIAGTTEMGGKMCPRCIGKAGVAVVEYAATFWSSLPTVFGLGDWANLNRD
ncbi:hypothetical protein SCHPADRAFT_932843, partial [Schizopora paradoxa]